MGVHTPSKNAYPLTQHHFQLKIDIITSKTGKHDAYHGKHYAYQSIYIYAYDVVSTRDGTPITPAHQGPER